jgi:hypothetical protein
MKAARTEWCGGRSVPGTGGVLVRHHDPANRGVEIVRLLSIAYAGPLDQRSNQPGTGAGNTTRLRRIWHGQLFPPPEASA